jgi:hypothetical protein
MSPQKHTADNYRSIQAADKKRKLVSPTQFSSMLIPDTDESALDSDTLETKRADRANSETVDEVDRQIDGALSTDDQTQTLPLDNNEPPPVVKKSKKEPATEPSEVTENGNPAHELSQKRSHHKKKSLATKREEKARAEEAAADQLRMQPRGSQLEAPSLPTSAIESSAGCQPESHEPIAQGDAHYGSFHSRLVFKSEPCAPNKIYLVPNDSSPEDDFGYKRMSAMEKFEKWRKKFLRLKDRDLRRNERVVYLIEGALHGPKNEATLWAAKLKSLTNQVQKEMPDTVVILVTSIPDSSFLANGLLRPWVDALRAFLQKDPCHFKVELKGDSISCAQQHEARLQEAMPEIEYVLAFITDLEHFQKHRCFPGDTVVPYESHKLKAKKKFDFKVRREGQPNPLREAPINASKEARSIVAVFPWISYERALEHAQQVKAAHDRALEYLDQASGGLIPKEKKPNTEYPPLEVLPFVEQDAAATVHPTSTAASTGADTKVVVDLTIEDDDEDKKEDRPKGARRKRDLDTGETLEVGAVMKKVKRT